MSLFSSGTGLDALIHRPRPSAWQDFLHQPCVFLARALYAWTARPPGGSGSPPVSVVCISDTHNTKPFIPDGDVLIHAGDLTHSGTFEELELAVAWLASQPHPIKIVVAGNHDVLLDAKQDGAGNRVRVTADPCKSPEALRAALGWRENGFIYLQNQGTVVTCPNGRRLSIYGSPLSPRNGNWAFQYPRAEDVWRGTFPEDIDVLVTHGPPRSHGDLLNLGCEHLLRELWRVRPRLHVFGHIHAAAGVETVGFDGLQAAYERTVMARGGFWNLMCTFWCFLVVSLDSLYGRVEERAGGCVLVNAAMVHGLRDDQMRQAVTVVI